MLSLARGHPAKEDGHGQSTHLAVRHVAVREVLDERFYFSARQLGAIPLFLDQRWNVHRPVYAGTVSRKEMPFRHGSGSWKNSPSEAATSA